MSHHKPVYHFFYVRSRLAPSPVPSELAIPRNRPLSKREEAIFALVSARDEIEQKLVRFVKGFPHTCVAYTTVYNGAGQKLVRFAWSTHNPIDRYDRRDARSRALYTLLMNPLEWREVLAAETGVRTKRRIMEILAEDDDAAFRLQRDARTWLATVDPSAPPSNLLVIREVEAD